MASSSSNAPAFFTVFLPEFCSHQLKITSAFKKHLENEVTGEAIVERSSTNEVWTVNLVKEGEDFLFKNGWTEFVSANGVTIGEFMVFQYRGNSRFTVDIFGTDGMEKLGPGKQTPVLLDGNSQDDVDDDNDDDDDDDGDDTDDEDYDVVDDTAKAVGAMKIGESILRCMSMNPFSFRVPMTKIYFVRNSMHLPTALSNRYIRGKDGQRVKLRTPEKKWSVDVSTYRATRQRKVYYLFRGEAFVDFLRHNRIQLGDVCVFEALDLSCNTLSVSVLRTSGQ